MTPATMKAMVTMGHGGMDQVVWHEDWPVPTPGPHEVLVKVAACGLNNTDVNTRLGWYSKAVTGATDDAGVPDGEDPTWGGAPLLFPRIQGADICGEVVAVGSEADAALMGKRVIADAWLRDWDDPLNKDKAGYFGSEMNGGFAEYTVIDHRNVGVVTCDLTDAELATFSCSYVTAEGMLTRSRVDAGDTVLITGASGGVGSALIQLAKRRGATVIGMASAAKHEALRALGADALLPRAPEDLVAAVKAATGRETVSVALDVVGGAQFPALLEVLERGGRYAVSGAIAGPIVELDLRTLYLSDLDLCGSTVTPHDRFREVLGYINRGEIRPLLAAQYPLRDFHGAQTAFLAKGHVGNIVVTTAAPE